MTYDGRGLWDATCRERIESRPLDAALSVDLAIVGGGYTGCAAALEAARSGAGVALLEARDIGHGGSGRNVGLVNAGLWLPPEVIERQMGAAAGPLIDALAMGPDAVFGLIARERIECEPVRRGTLHLAHSAAGLADLRDRLRQGNRAGAPLRLLPAGEAAARTGSALWHGALHDARAGTIHPLAYCRGLARAAAASGARIHERTPVTRIARDGGAWRLTANGRQATAGAVLLATNAYHDGLAGLLPPRFSQVSYSQFATAPLPEAARARILPGAEGCWDTALVMSSVRLDGAGRLIVGGMGDALGPGRAVHAAWAQRKLARLFPWLGPQPLDHVWSGRIAMTRDHVPKVVAAGRGALAVYGYSGRGIGPGTVLGTAAARALLDGDPRALPLPVLDFHSERLSGARTAFYELGATLAHAVAARR